MLRAPGKSSRAISNCFGISSTPRFVVPVTLPPGRARLAEAHLHRIGRSREDDRNGRNRLFDRQRARRIGDDRRHSTADQFKRDDRHAIELSLRPTIFDRYILALDVPGFLQALPERDYCVLVATRRPAVDECHQRPRGLLRSRRERPSRRTAEGSDEFAPSKANLPLPYRAV